MHSPWLSLVYFHEVNYLYSISEKSKTKREQKKKTNKKEKKPDPVLKNKWVELLNSSAPVNYIFHFYECIS